MWSWFWLQRAATLGVVVLFGVFVDVNASRGNHILSSISICSRFWRYFSLQKQKNCTITLWGNRDNDNTVHAVNTAINIRFFFNKVIVKGILTLLNRIMWREGRSSKDYNLWHFDQLLNQVSIRYHFWWTYPISGFCRIPRILCNLSIATLCWKLVKPIKNTSRYLDITTRLDAINNEDHLG